MKGALLVGVVVCVCFAVAVSAQSSCAIPDIYWNLYDVVATDFFVPDGNTTRVMQTNLCKDIEQTCARTANAPCTACQWIDQGLPSQRSYCLAHSQGEVYAPLNTTVFGTQAKGFQLQLQGDADNCPNGQRRRMYMDVLCSQPNTSLIFMGEFPTCTYNLRLFLSGNCAVTAASFTPTFNITSITPTSLAVAIDDGYEWQYWTYTVKVNDVLAYSGNDREAVVRGLNPGTSYRVVVERVSGPNAAMSVTSPSVTQTVSTLPTRVGNPAVTVTGKGTGIAIGMVITVVIVAALFGIYKYALPFLADKFGNSSNSNRGYSVHNADADDLIE